MGEWLLRECRFWLVSLKIRDVYDGKDVVYFYDNEVLIGDIFYCGLLRVIRFWLLVYVVYVFFVDCFNNFGVRYMY